MPPKRVSENQEGLPCPQEDKGVEDDLRRQILELKRKLTISEKTRERTLQESIRERNMVMDRYQEQIDRISAQRRKGHDIPMPRQVQFDGKSSWESFVKSFIALQQSCNWDEDESPFRLQSSLRGKAAEFAYNQTTPETTASYGKLMRALETRYKEHRNSSSYFAELESRKLETKEKLGEYVSDIRKLVIKGSPSDDDITRETINVRHFIKGLQDQQAALNIGMKDPKTIEEARTILETYNSLKDEIRGGARVREIHPVKKPSSTMLQKVGFKSLAEILNLHLERKLTVQRRPAVRPNSYIVCYRCGEVGHISKQCSGQMDKTVTKKTEN